MKQKENPRPGDEGNPEEFSGSDTKFNSGKAASASGGAKKFSPPLKSVTTIIAEVTDTFINDVLTGKWERPRLDDDESMRRMHDELLSRTNGAIIGLNATLDKSEQVARLRRLAPEQVGSLLIGLFYVVRICEDLTQDTDKDMLAIYQYSGPRRGTYIENDTEIGAAIAKCERLSLSDKTAVREQLKEEAQRVLRCVDRELVPMNNGVFNYRTKELLEFGPEFVFLSKAAIDLDPYAQHPTLILEDGTPWLFEDWLRDLVSGDEELYTVVLQIIGATLRPNVDWDKAAYFVSESGNNGKGTLLLLMKNLLGMNNWASVTLDQLGMPFGLQEAVNVQAILTDENDVGTFIEKSANLKAIISHDAVQINRKHKPVVTQAFRGFMVQCLNEFPRVKDRSDSFYRRQLYIPFDKSFTGSAAKEIKGRFTSDPALLRYVAKKVLMDLPDYWELSEPKRSLETLDDYKRANDPVRDFWFKMSPEFKWDLIPTDFSYELFKCWFALNNPGGKVLSERQFSTQLKAAVEADPDWEHVVQQRHKGLMDGPEPLIVEYDVKGWRTSYTGKDPDKMATPDLKQDRYSGYLRVLNTAPILRLEEYKAENDLVRVFWAETKDDYSWDLLPFDFLYSAFKAWFVRNNYPGAVLGKQAFIKDCVYVLAQDPNWWGSPGKVVRSKGRMDWPEPAIITMGIDDWKNPNYGRSDPDMVASPELATTYRGALRMVPRGGNRA